MAKPDSKSGSSSLAIFLLGLLIGAFIMYTAIPHLAQLVPRQNMTGITQPTTLPTIGQPRSAAANIVGISAETNAGIIGTASVELVPGRGRVLISTNPFIEPDTQQSVSIARAVAENYTGITLDSVDTIISFDLPIEDMEGQVIGGPSAGAALTVAIVAAAQNKSVRSDAAITGTILPDGTIGTVGGVPEKAQAAGEAGMALFIVPKGQGEVKYYEKVEERKAMNGFSVVRISYVPRTLSLNNYTQQWNMTTVEVADIAEAARYAITVSH